MPTRFRVELTATAQTDIDEIWRFIARDSITEANKFVRKPERQLRTLRQLPERCALIQENRLLGRQYRHLLYGKYRNIFYISGKTVYVARIIHGAREIDASMLE